MLSRLQAWLVLRAAGRQFLEGDVQHWWHPPRFADRDMDAVRTHLVHRGAQVILLLEPPFDHSAQGPGYIKGHPPGVRENGGQ